MSTTEQHMNAWERFFEMAAPSVPVRILAQTGDRWPVEIGTINVTDPVNHHQIADFLRALADEFDQPAT